MKNTGLVSYLQWLMLALFALTLLSCDKSNQSDTAVLTIKVPAEFVKANSANVQPASISGKPDNINRIIIVVSGPKRDLSSADILAAGGTLSVEVPAFTDLTVSGFAYAGQTLKFKGSTPIPALKRGETSAVSLTLRSVDGTGGTIIIDTVPATSGTVSVFEVDSSGVPVGGAIASAGVTDGQFTLNIPSFVVPSSHFVIRADINGETLESRYVNAGSIEISPLTHAVSRLVNQLAAAAQGGLNDINVQEILEMQTVLENIRNLYGVYDPNNELTLDEYADALINILKSDIQTSAVATSAIASDELCGRVVDSTQKPLDGIRIAVRDFDTFLLTASTTTGTDGRYCVNVPASQETDPFTQFTTNGEYIVGAINLTTATTAASQWWTPNGVTAQRIDAGKLSFLESQSNTANFTLPAGARIQGVVQSASIEGTGGDPLPGIRVLARDKATQFLVAGAITDANGHYLLNVPPGDYIIEALNETSQPYASATYTGNGVTNNRNLGEVVSLQNNDSKTANLDLDAGVELRGRVTENSTGVSGVRVYIDNDEGGPATRFLISKMDGNYNVWLKPDQYKVYAYGHQTPSLVDLRSGSSPPLLAFSGPVAKFQTVVQYLSAGVSKAKARLFFDNDGSLEFADTGFSKSDGSLTLYSANGGDHVVEARVEGSEDYGASVYDGQTQRQQGTPVPLTTGDTTVQSPFTLPPAGVLTGTVTTDGVTPSPNVQVVVRDGGTLQANNFVATRTRGDGTYTLSLPGDKVYSAVVFNDGTHSVTCTNNIYIANKNITQLDVTLSTQSQCNVGNVQNLPPVANAGANRSVSAGVAVSLDGSASSDANNDNLTYAWSFVSVPAGSTASLADETTVNPSFTPDKVGDYVVQLIVNDGQYDSTASTVTITAVNDKPLADAGGNQDVTVTHTVTLDGSASSDVNGDILTYSWSFVSQPSGSTASLSDSTAVSPTFVADMVGTYVLQLIVNDGTVDSDPATVSIQASPASVKLQLIGTSLIGIGRTAQLGVTLTDPAPAGGVTVTLSSDNTGVVSLGQNTTVSFAQGETTAQVTLTGVAAGTTTLHATAANYVEGTLDVNVTLNLISLPSTLNVPLGQSASLPVTIAPDPAPPGGLVVGLVSSDPATGELTTSSVTIAEGTKSANTTINGLKPGNLTVTASNANYASFTSNVSVTAALNITDASLTFNSSFPQEITVELQSGGSNISAPQPVTVTLTPTDPSCVAVTSPITIDSGFVSSTATVSYAGTATLLCTTTVTASAPNITSDTLDVTVNSPSTLQFSYPNVTVGAGLQTSNLVSYMYVNLGTTNHGGVTVHIQSNNPQAALVAPDVSTAGTESIDVFVPNGQSVAHYITQGVEGATPGIVTLTASASGFLNGTGTVNVVQPALKIISLGTSTTSLSADSPFRLQLGIPTTDNSNISSYQAVRVGGPGITATIASSDPAVGQLTTSVATAGTVTVDIAPGQTYSPTTVAGGGVAFHPLTSGNTTVSATIPGFIATTAASVDVNVTAPSLSFYNPTVTVGAGLQTSNSVSYMYVDLGATNHGGVTVRIQSSDPNIALVAPNINTAGAGFIDVDVPDGQSRALYIAQGMEEVTGSVTFTASAPGFNTGTGTVNVVQPALNILNLSSTSTPLSADDAFYVIVGIPTANNTISPNQAARFGGPGLTATIVSSDSTVGQLTTSAATADTVTVAIAPGQINSPYDVVSGGVAFHALANGTTTVSASIPGFIPLPTASVDINVVSPVLKFQYASKDVGSGLQTNGSATAMYVDLGVTNHGGVTVRIQSDNPQLALVAPDINTAGTAFIDVFVPDGQSRAYYITQGVEDVTGTTTLTASATGFINGSSTVNVVQPALRLISLTTSTTTLSADAPFRVVVGIPDVNHTRVSPYQAARVGGPGITATIVSSDSNVGQLVTSAQTAGTVTVSIAPGELYSPNDVASGGVAFDPLTSGTTTVSATIPGFIAVPQASGDVIVAAPTLRFTYQNANVGAGLQMNSNVSYMYVDLGATNHGGVTVHIQSSNSQVALVAPDLSTAGSEFIDVFVPDGQSRAYYMTQGVEGVTGSVTLNASAPGFTDGSGTVNVVQPALRIVSLGTTSTTSSADTPFRVAVGIPDANNTTLSQYQAVRAGGTTLTATIISSDSTVGQLTTNTTTGGTVTVDIAPTQVYSPYTVASGGVAFRPLATGVTTVSASILGIIATTAATVGVTVSP